VLIWIVQAGGATILVGIFVSLLLENFAFWHGLDYRIKLGATLLLAAGLGAAAEFVLSANLLAAIPVWIKSIVLMLLNWAVMQYTYMKSKATTYAATARNGTN